MFEKNTKKCFLAPFWPLFWPKLVKMTKKNFFLDSDAKPFPTRGHMPIFEQNYDNWYFRSQNGLSGPKKARKFWKTLKSSLGSWESLETIRICIIRQIRSAKVDIFTKTISPPPPPPPPPPDSYDSNTPPGHIWPRGKNTKTIGPNGGIHDQMHLGCATGCKGGHHIMLFVGANGEHLVHNHTDARHTEL